MSDWKIRFGTAGTSDSFAAQGYKSSLDVPEYTAKMGLNAFEYQCGRGVRLGLDKAAKMAALAGPKDILFSVHAPYYISMSSLEEEKRLNSIQYLLQSAAVCSVDKRITPCIDFGHLNARTLGGIRSKEDYAAILDRMAEKLGDQRAERFHVHFSRIEYSAGGEKRHWTFAETQFGPEPQPLMELLAERKLQPVIICESAGTQAEDAGAMQQMYHAACKT